MNLSARVADRRVFPAERPFVLSKRHTTITRSLPPRRLRFGNHIPSKPRPNNKPRHLRLFLAKCKIALEHFWPVRNLRLSSMFWQFPAQLFWILLSYTSSVLSAPFHSLGTAPSSATTLTILKIIRASHRRPPASLLCRFAISFPFFRNALLLPLLFFKKFQRMGSTRQRLEASQFQSKHRNCRRIPSIHASS